MCCYPKVKGFSYSLAILDQSALDEAAMTHKTVHAMIQGLPLDRNLMIAYNNFHKVTLAIVIYNSQLLTQAFTQMMFI